MPPAKSCPVCPLSHQKPCRFHVSTLISGHKRCRTSAKQHQTTCELKIVNGFGRKEKKPYICAHFARRHRPEPSDVAQTRKTMADLTHLINRKGLGQTYSPDELFDKFNEYLVWKQSGGGWTWKQELVKPTKLRNGSNHNFTETLTEHQIIPVPVQTPLTVKEFCLRIGMSHRTFMSYLNPHSPKFEAYGIIAEYITDVCAVELFNGGVTGAYNGNMIVALVGKHFAGDPDGGSDRVSRISHSIRFDDYTQIQQAEEVKQLSEHVEQPQIARFRSKLAEDASYVPLPDEDEARIERALTIPTPPVTPPVPNSYDNVPNYHSSQHGWDEYHERNGTYAVQEDE